MKALLSVTMGLALWAAFYRIEIGPWCPLMFLGPLPLVGIIIGTSASYRTLTFLGLGRQARGNSAPEVSFVRPRP